MHQNPHWLVFLALIACCVLGYTGYTGIKFYQYKRLIQHVPIHQIQWNLLPLGEDDFALQAYYQFSLDGTSYEGQIIWDEHYLNEFAAQESLNELNKKKWKAWIDPTWPSYSALQKKFPIKECLSAIVLWGLLIYFIWLGRYVTQFSPTGYNGKN